MTTRPSAEDAAAARDLLGPDDTAVVVCDLPALRDRLDLLTAGFGPEVGHTVAIKTMPHPQMLATLVDAGFGLEAASIEEVDLARTAGATSERIIFDSPAKTRREIERCHQDHPGMLCNANSLDELARYPDEPRFRIGLRVNPELATTAPDAFAVSDPSSKFGVPLSSRPEILAACLERPVTALHVHAGSQVREVDAHVTAAAAVVELAGAIDRHRADHGDPTRITTIDIGGGLPADPPDVGPDESIMTRYTEQLRRDAPALFEYTVRTEFGQWVHTHTGWAASRVEYVDPGPPARATIHLGADYFLRDVYGDARPFSFAVHRPDGTLDRDPATTYDLAGPLCFAGDYLGRAVPLPALTEGDWLVVEGTGANTYGLWSRHCSRAVPAVVGVDDGVATLWSPRRPVIA